MNTRDSTFYYSLIVITASLLCLCLVYIHFGYNDSIAWPKSQQRTYCIVRNASVERLNNGGGFNATWNVVYDTIQGKNVSIILHAYFKIYEEALEAITIQYKMNQIYRCYFDKKYPNRFVWSLDHRISRGKRYFGIAIHLGLIILVNIFVMLFYCLVPRKEKSTNNRQDILMRDL